MRSNIRFSSRLFISVFASLSLLAAVHARAQKASVRSDTIDFVKERAMIPGETMGQKLESLLFWSEKQEQRRFPNMQKIFPSSEIDRGKNTFRLKKGKTIQPKWTDGTTLSSYMSNNHIGGVIVIKQDKIRLEAYGDGYNQHTVWTSFSVAKSVSSMLLGVALKEGDIQSMDDSLSKYIPELKGEDYGKVTVRQLLTMTSGIKWNEDYTDPHSDVALMNRGACDGTESHILTYMKHMKLIHKPGTVWHYSTGEAGLLGILIQKATGKTLAQYLSEKIWKPWGMEQNAYWLTDECSGLNSGGHGISATLRDYARLGSVMLHKGKKGNVDLFAGEWIENATTPLYKTNDEGGGYGYLWWCFPNGSYAAFGIFGQMIYVNPKENLVIAQYAAWPAATSKVLTQKRMEFVEAVERGLK